MANHTDPSPPPGPSFRLPPGRSQALLGCFIILLVLLAFLWLFTSLPDAWRAPPRDLPVNPVPLVRHS
jgi:hypothetical protein